jgi:hypothetical protein
MPTGRDVCDYDVLSTMRVPARPRACQQPRSQQLCAVSPARVGRPDARVGRDRGGEGNKTWHAPTLPGSLRLLTFLLTWRYVTSLTHCVMWRAPTSVPTAVRKRYAFAAVGELRRT